MRAFLYIVLLLIAPLFAPRDAHAMHIGEGILPLGWAALGYAMSAPFVALALYKLAREQESGLYNKPLVGLVGAAVFVISCMPIPVPTAGTCSHPAGTALAAILIGPLYSVLAATAALVLQALFLAHGGISTLGANVFSMGVAGSFIGFACYALARRLGAPLYVSAFAAGVAGDWATYAATSATLAASLAGPGEGVALFKAIALAFVPTQLPLGLLEGVLTSGAAVFLSYRKPELLGGAYRKGAGA